jgi:hypothetical protein
MSTQGFRYALEPVLLTRTWTLRDWQTALADCNVRLLRQEGVRAALQARHAAVIEDWDKLSASGAILSVERFSASSTYLADLQLQLDAAILAEQEIGSEQLALMQEVAHAQRALEGVEEHRDAALEEFRSQRSAAEFKAADDQWNIKPNKENSDGRQT